MSVQDEHNKKLVEISFEASKMTLKNFAKTIKFLIINGIKLYNSKPQKTLKQLAKTENSISKIDLENLKLNNKDFKTFRKIAKDCGLKYSLIYDKNANKYTFFFNSGKAEIYEQVYSRLREEINKKDNNKNISIFEKIKQKQKIVSEQQKEKKQKQTNKISR